MRRLILAAVVLGCAQPGFPPGGPEDKLPPRIVGVSPDSGTVNVVPGAVVFRFDGVVNETPQGATELADLFLISPRDGEPRVNWKRNAITVRPRRRWRPNTTYTVTLLPGLADLRGNAMREGASIVFSTGKTMPDTRLEGIVFDWAAGQPVPRAAVEAVSRPDSTVYVARADSSGRFVLRHLRSGSFVVRGFADPNNNGELDPREAWDSTTLSLRDTAHVELLAFVHDTIGPGIGTVVVRDSVTLRVSLDRPVDPVQTMDSTRFALLAADSTVIPLRAVRAVTEADRAREDSLRAATDTGEARDTTGAPRRDATARRRPPRDTVAAEPAPQPSRPIPVSEVSVGVGAPLKPGGTYRLRARNLRGLLGAVRTSERVFSVPAAAQGPPPDTTGAAPPAAADTTRRRRR